MVARSEGFNMLNPLIIYEIAICPYPAAASPLPPNGRLPLSTRGEEDRGVRRFDFALARTEGAGVERGETPAVFEDPGEAAGLQIPARLCREPGAPSS